MTETNNDQNPITPEPIRSQQAMMSQHVSVSGIILIALYLVSVSILLLYGVVRLWPSEHTLVIFGNLAVEGDIQIILIVALAGALGSQVHAIRSFFWYVGNRDFVRSWIFMYLLIPFVGSSLSLLFYFVLRGGLFSTQADFNDTSIFGFTAVAGLVGMFSNQAALKLKEVAESLFATQEPTRGADHVSPEDVSGRTGE